MGPTCGLPGVPEWAWNITGCMVAVEDDFTSGPGNNTAATSAFEMNPNHSYGPGSGFYGQPGSAFAPASGAPNHGYPPHAGPMSPYANQNQGQPPPNRGQQPSMYGNQNSPFNNQNQSSSYTGPGPGSYNNQSSGFHPQPTMQTYYNNHSPTHQFQFGGPHPPPLRHPSPPPQGPRGPAPPMGMMIGSRIPHPTMNSPNQNVVTGNQIKTENIDLKQGSMYAAASQGYSQSGFGFNGFGGPPGSVTGPPRPLMSPMSPHGRMNLSPGGPPNLSPREGPPNMSPHSGHPPMGSNLYAQHQNSPGNNAISTIASQASTFPAPSQHHQSYSSQYEYFNKQSQPSQMQQSPMSSSSGFGGQKDDLTPEQRLGSFPSDDKLSDVQSNASVRSGDDSNPTLTNLVSVKKEPSDTQTGDTLNNKTS